MVVRNHWLAEYPFLEPGGEKDRRAPCTNAIRICMRLPIDPMATTPGAVTVPATTPEVPASSTTVPKNERLPRLVNDNLGHRRWHHRQQRTA
jgi:hypothetical protein